MRKSILRALLTIPAILTGLMITGAGWTQSGDTSAPVHDCHGDNGGITLSPGFCATVFADRIGHARHMAVGRDGTVYVNTWSGRYYGNDKPPAGGMLVALKDTTGSGKADQVTRFGPSYRDGSHGGTGIALYNGGLFAEVNDRIVRYALPDGAGVPTGAPETILSGLPLSGDHPMHPFAIDTKGNLYVDLGSATNSCQVRNRSLESPGHQPCTELTTRAGIWRYDANRTNQRFSPAERYATGIRNGEGFAFDAEGRLFVTQHGRDQLSQNFPKLYRPQQGADLPAEELLVLEQNADYGWPECYYDGFQQRLVLAPEYGGDGGRSVGICAQKREPVAAFPAHWAPNDLAIYNDHQFPEPWQGGAFIAFHGSWNRAPAPQGGYNVVFQPLRNGRAAGPFIIFADGFAGAYKEPGRAAHRPSGLAVAPDGALFISDDAHGRIWRVTFSGAATGQAAQAPQNAPAARTATVPRGEDAVLPPEGIHPEAGNVASLPVPPGASAGDVALGARVFHGEADGGTCAGCHGSDAKGTPLGPNLTDNKWQWTDGSLGSLTDVIANGVQQPKNYNEPMPAKGGADLTPADVRAVAAYVWALNRQRAQ